LKYSFYSNVYKQDFTPLQQLQVEYNRKPYPIYRMTPFSITLIDP